MVAYRVYDDDRKEWIKEDVYLNQNGELFKIKQSVFGLVKMPLALNKDRYVYQYSIGLLDKNNKDIFVGDYLKAHVGENKDVVGLVVYINELSSYIILCEDSKEYYTLGEPVSEYIEIIGNIFDGYEGVKENNE